MTKSEFDNSIKDWEDLWGAVKEYDCDEFTDIVDEDYVTKAIISSVFALSRKDISLSQFLGWMEDCVIGNSYDDIWLWLLGDADKEFYPIENAEFEDYKERLIEWMCDNELLVDDGDHSDYQREDDDDDNDNYDESDDYEDYDDEEDENYDDDYDDEDEDEIIPTLSFVSPQPTRVSTGSSPFDGDIWGKRITPKPSFESLGLDNIEIIS